ncbi:MAG: AAA family ATPase [Deltaproteobacteria bacterium]|nr:AAA family ATPase [Deltaproteobacteria bacterium]
MAWRFTKETRYIRLPESRIREIEELVASWPYETKAFLRARLNQYSPPSGALRGAWRAIRSLFAATRENRFVILRDSQILTDWQKRFELSGQTNPRSAWNKLLEKEVSAADYAYLVSLLDRELSDVHVPPEIHALLGKVYRAHVRKEYLSDPEVPKAPLLLVVGPSGSGKTATVARAIEEVIFRHEILPEVDLEQKKEEKLAGEPIWRTIEAVDPELAAELDRRRRLRFYTALSRAPLLRRLLHRRISRNLAELVETRLPIDYAVVTPNDYQTALAGEPGNYFKKALGDPQRTVIRHVEEAHSAFGRADGRHSAAESQQKTLVDTGNIVLDEIIQGRRDCLLIATTDQAERFDPAIYRRFVEKGRIIDISEFWREPKNLAEIVRLELLRADIRVGHPPAGERAGRVSYLPREELEGAVERLYRLFEERALKLTPSYVRKLVRSLFELRGDFRMSYLDDSFLVRTAFEHVARNAYGDLFGKVVGRLDRNVRWEEYVGEIKDEFSEMANNCLRYGVSDEKGVVLNGPPGSGKTFLGRAWLSENRDINDLSVRSNDLQDPSNPVDGPVENLERVYDIAKMIAPALVFFDEGDALAPRRSPSGGSPSDKLTNKFLSIIDGESSLSRVFTVLTTNRLDILDPALIRSKRLKVLEVSGDLRQVEFARIVERRLADVPLAPELSTERIVEAARGISNTPADYAAFVEKACALRDTEYEVILRLRALTEAPDAEKERFVKFNFKTLQGVLEALGAPSLVRSRIRSRPLDFSGNYAEFLRLVESIRSTGDFPMVPAHLTAARQEIAHSPVRRGKVQLDEFLEAELSQEPQVGFVIGVGASEVAGVLLPVATSLTYSLSPEKVLVTGAVSSAAPAAAELDMAVQMTQQSAKEAFTLVKNYLQALMPKVSIARLLGEFLEKYTVHHQLLSASYSVGGPSAGYALAINTLSAILHIPVYHDFGITGAPWTKGVKRGEVGSSVIIGGHRKKAEKVLQYLRRMYMPLQNYRDLDDDFVATYWAQGKDVLGVTHFGDLVPDALCLGPEYEKKLLDLIALRIEYKLAKYRGDATAPGAKERILGLKAELRSLLEAELLRRLVAVRSYLRDPASDPHLSLEEILKGEHGTAPGLEAPHRRQRSSRRPPAAPGRLVV